MLRKFYLACKEEDEENETKDLVVLHESESECESDEIIEEDGDLNNEVEELPDDMKWLNEYFPELEGIPNQVCFIYNLNNHGHVTSK